MLVANNNKNYSSRVFTDWHCSPPGTGWGCECASMSIFIMPVAFQFWGCQYGATITVQFYENIFWRATFSGAVHRPWGIDQTSGERRGGSARNLTVVSRILGTPHLITGASLEKKWRKNDYQTDVRPFGPWWVLRNLGARELHLWLRDLRVGGLFEQVRSAVNCKKKTRQM